MVTSTTEDLQLVWVANQLPMGFYHCAGRGHTVCGIPIRGFGYSTSLRNARRNLCQPCRLCYLPIKGR